MNDSDIFDQYEKLIAIEIGDRKYAVPENNTLLRCFQFLWMETVSMGNFCWNGDCANCQIWIAGESLDKPVLACRTQVKEGMKIVKMSEEMKIVVSDEL